MGHSVFEFGALYLGNNIQHVPRQPTGNGDIPQYDRQAVISIGPAQKERITWIKPDGYNLLVADRALMVDVSWDDLDLNDMVAGKRTQIGGQCFRCRLLQLGNHRDAPNEWEQILNITGTHTDNALWNWDEMYFWGCDVVPCNVCFATNSVPCIGIVIHSRDGKVSGLQLRKMGELEEKQARYTLFSSSFADGTGKYRAAYGCNSGYIEDVLYPRIKWNGTIALTEGRFKAITLAKMGFLVVNMHSISNWDPAGDVALGLTNRYPKTKRFLLAYDSEHNPAVFKSAGSLYGKLSKCRPVLFATWDPIYGKGIDDVVNGGNFEHLKSVTPDKFFKKAG